MRYAVAAIFGLGAILFGSLYLVLVAPNSDDAYASCRSTRIAGGAEPLGGALSLIDESGTRVSEAEVFTRPSLVYFGYTFCPDFCPVDAVRNSEVVGLLDTEGYDVGHVFVTVDPARDTPEVLTEYTSYFDDKMLGLTGTDEEIAVAARAYRVYYARNGTGDEYLMDHTAFTYLVGRGGNVVELFRREIEAPKMADSLACFLDRMS